MPILYVIPVVVAASVVGAGLGYAFRGKVNKGLHAAGTEAKSVENSLKGDLQSGLQDVQKKLK